ncbi:hypothetical protein D3C80_1697820 [compost metagenome]
MLVTIDIVQPQTFDIVQRRPQPHRIGDVTGSRLKPSRCRLIQRFFKGDVGNHIAAPLPRWQSVQQLCLTVHRTNTRWAKHLVA